MGPFFPRKFFFFGWGLRPSPNLPRPLAGPANYAMMRIIKQVYLIFEMMKFKPTMPLSEPKKVKIATKDQI